MGLEATRDNTRRIVTDIRNIFFQVSNIPNFVAGNKGGEKISVIYLGII